MQGIGADFIVVKTKQAIQSSRDNSELAKALTDYYTLTGLTVVTVTGNIVSTIEDFTIDESSWQLQEVMLANGETYSRDQFVSVSEKYVFVQPNIAADLLPEEAVQEAEPTEETEPATEEEAYLIGMTLRADVASEDGSFVINEGTVLTKELIDEAKENGVLAALIMDAE